MRARLAVIDDLRAWPKRYVSPSQLAVYAGVARRTVYYHMHKGALPFVRLGGTVIRIRKRDALAYVGETPLRKPVPKRAQSVQGVPVNLEI